jgi:hypothetical protein
MNEMEEFFSGEEVIKLEKIKKSLPSIETSGQWRTFKER